MVRATRLGPPLAMVIAGCAPAPAPHAPGASPVEGPGTPLPPSAAATPATATPATATLFSPAKRTRVEAAVDAFMASSATPGLAVAVVESGRLTWAHGFGKADLEDGAPATEHTLFRLGSISRSLTATAAMQLYERGQLDLDAPAQKYCAASAKTTAPITTRQLLGRPAGSRGDEQEPRGYALVGCVLEGAAGRAYAEVVRETVLGPAGMTQTVIDDRFAVVPERARFYEKTAPGDAARGRVQNADPVDSSRDVPGTGWLASADDMARFEVALLGDRLVRRSSREAMWTPLPGAADATTGASYGLGWQVGPSTFGHGAAQPGTSAAFVVAPRRGAGVVVLANLGGVDAGGLAGEILRVLLDER
jgi:CubicO group peptidase (beta-lactamase class C family)